MKTATDTTSTINSIRDELAHGCDGPITSFVLICRATELAGRGFDPSNVANALIEELEMRGMMAADHGDRIEVTGS